MRNNKPTLQEYAMRYGTGMGLLWVFKFMLFPLGLKIPFLQLLFVVLTLGVPVVGYMFAKRFRDSDGDGTLGFLRAFSFVVCMYLFASMLVAVAHYVYFRYLDNGFIVETWRNLWEQVKAGADTLPASAIQQYEDAFNAVAALSPLELTFQLVSNNVFLGILMSVPTALLVLRNKKILKIWIYL